MKVTIALVGIFAVCGVAVANPHEEHYKHAVPYQPRIFEDLINSTINAVVSMIANYDPLYVEYHEQTLLGHEGKITNLYLDGFSNVVATHIKLTGLLTYTLELVTEAPRFLATLEHWKVDGEHFYGEGDARVEINDLKVTIKAKINPLAVQIKALEIVPSIGSASVVVRGLYNNAELSQKVSNDITEFLNDDINNNKELHELFSKIVLELIQSILGKY